MKTWWREVTLAEVCAVIAGQSPDGSAYNSNGQGLPFYQGKKEFTDKYLGPATTWTTEVTKIAEAGDILMSVRAPVGPINLATERICIGRGLAAIRPTASVDLAFLWYALVWMQPVITGSEGAVFASINKAQIGSLSFPIPPLDEQKRIVAVLDEVFEGISRACANAEANLADARNFFSLQSATIFDRVSERAIAMPKVAEVAAPHKGSIRTGPFGSQLLHSEFVDSGVAVLGIDNAVKNQFEWAKRRYITDAKYRQLARYRVHPGDVIITIMGTCGRCAVVPDDIPEAINTKHLCCITLDRFKCLPEFLHAYFLFSQTARDYLEAQMLGSIMDGLNMGIIKDMPVILPTLEVQRETIEAVSALLASTNRLTELYKEQIANLNSLRKAVMQKAFAGELT